MLFFVVDTTHNLCCRHAATACVLESKFFFPGNGDSAQTPFYLFHHFLSSPAALSFFSPFPLERTIHTRWSDRVLSSSLVSIILLLSFLPYSIFLVFGCSLRLWSLQDLSFFLHRKRCHQRHCIHYDSSCISSRCLRRDSAGTARRERLRSGAAVRRGRLPCKGVGVSGCSLGRAVVQRCEGLREWRDCLFRDCGSQRLDVDDSDAEQLEIRRGAAQRWAGGVHAEGEV